MSQIIYNAIRCPDGTVIESRNQWDYVEHAQQDGRYYAVDGGLSYCKRANSDNDYEELTLTIADNHAVIREYFSWKSIYGADGTLLKKPKFTKLKNITEEHIFNIINTFAGERYAIHIRNLLVNELKYRGKDFLIFPKKENKGDL